MIHHTRMTLIIRASLHFLGMGLVFLAYPGDGFSLDKDEAQREYEGAQHLTGDIENGKRIYLICAVCHRPEGWGTEDGTYPQIAGQWSSVIIKQLADIRARIRDNPLMYPFALPRILGGVQEIADVAAYIARLPMTPRNGQGPEEYVAQGQRIYDENCVDCHGELGQGDANRHIPALWGQHYHYLLRQFEAIKNNRRHNADPDMQKRICKFSTIDAQAVMAYVARLTPPKEKLADSVNWVNPDFPNYVRSPTAPKKTEEK